MKLLIFSLFFVLQCSCLPFVKREEDECSNHAIVQGIMDEYSLPFDKVCSEYHKQNGNEKETRKSLYIKVILII